LLAQLIAFRLRNRRQLGTNRSLGGGRFGQDKGDGDIVGHQQALTGQAKAQPIFDGQRKWFAIGITAGRGSSFLRGRDDEQINHLFPHIVGRRRLARQRLGQRLVTGGTAVVAADIAEVVVLFEAVAPQVVDLAR
jgi:hypothetical protein